MCEHAAGWRQGPDGRWYPPINEPELPPHGGAERLVEIADLVNSGVLTTTIDEAVDDPELAV